MTQKFNRRRWMPLVETLESRAVLSVCGVTCELTDGMLHVQGTAADDLIAVRYDAEAASVSVMGRDEELIGQYSVADVRGLNINGLGGNDLLHVDPALERTLASGAEGENAASSSNMHSHGTIIPSSTSNKPTSSAFANYGPTLGPSLAPALSSFSVGNAATTAGGSANLSVTSTSVTEHNSHGATSGPDFSLTSHIHDSPAAGAMIATVAGMVSMQNHGHAAAYRSMATGSADASGMQHDSSVVEEASGEWELDEHDKHEVAATSNVTFGKLVAKPCTVSYSGGLVVTAVDGKRQCNCEQKAQAAEEIKQSLAGKNGAGGEGLANALAECVPCQQGLLTGLPKEFQTCSTPLMSGKSMTILPVLTLLEEHHGSACPTRSSAEDAAVTETAWLESLQYVGWPLMAASLALVPALFERREKKNNEKDAEPVVDWLFGRLKLEPLLARS